MHGLADQLREQQQLHQQGTWQGEQQHLDKPQTVKRGGAYTDPKASSTAAHAATAAAQAQGTPLPFSHIASSAAPATPSAAAGAHKQHGTDCIMSEAVHDPLTPLGKSRTDGEAGVCSASAAPLPSPACNGGNSIHGMHKWRGWALVVGLLCSGRHGSMVEEHRTAMQVKAHQK